MYNSKYKLLNNKNDSIVVDGKKLYRIQALKDFGGDVKEGDIGGYIEFEKNLSQKGDCWVSSDARVYGNAWVFGNAWVSGNARVYGNAKVSGYAWVYDDTKVYGNAKVYGSAWVSSRAEVYSDARVYGNAQVSGDACVSGSFWQ